MISFLLLYLGSYEVLLSLVMTRRNSVAMYDVTQGQLTVQVYRSSWNFLQGTRCQKSRLTDPPSQQKSRVHKFVIASQRSVEPHCHEHNVARTWRLHKTGIGLTTGFIGSHTVTHNYSVYTLTAPYSSLQYLPSLHTVSSLVACRPISQDPFACNSATLL
jgi:hypothetical protein